MVLIPPSPGHHHLTMLSVILTKRQTLFACQIFNARGKDQRSKFVGEKCTFLCCLHIALPMAQYARTLGPQEPLKE